MKGYIAIAYESSIDFSEGLPYATPSERSEAIERAKAAIAKAVEEGDDASDYELVEVTLLYTCREGGVRFVPVVSDD